MKLPIIAITIAFLPLLCFSQQASKNGTETLYTQRHLLADFSYFKSALETAHPSLYRYQPKDSLDAWFLAGFKKVDHPMGDIEFWVLLESILTKVGSAHTDVVPGPAASDLHRYGVHNVVPFRIFIRDNRLYLKSLRGARDTSLRMGAEILTINGEPAIDILMQLRRLLPGDGYSHEFKDYKLEKAAFGGLYNLLHGDLASYLVTFRDGSTIKTRTLNSLTYDFKKPATTGDGLNNTTHFVPVIAIDNSLPAVTYPSDIPSTAILKIAEFAYDDYESFHRKLFKELKKRNIGNLVIDLRDNAGGYDNVCINLMKHLMEKDFRYAKMSEGVTDAGKLQALAQNIRNTKPAFIDYSDTQHKLFQREDPEDQLQRPLATFKGKVYVLINNGTFSAAVLMATALKEQRDCTLIGSETGGGRAGCDGGTSVVIQLPYTGFELHMPLLWAYSMTSQPDYGDGLKPDVDFVPNALDIYNDLYKHIDPFLRIIKSTILKSATSDN